MIETERLILRPQIEADYEALCAIWADPEVVRFISGVPSTREQTWHRLVRGAGMWALKGYGPFAIIDKRDGRYLGDAGHADYHRGLGPSFDPSPEAGWVLASHAHGRGYATEAGARAVRYGFDELGEDALFSVILPENTRSAAVACGDASLKMDFDGTEAAAPGVSVSGVAACVEYQDHPE